MVKSTHTYFLSTVLTFQRLISYAFHSDVPVCGIAAEARFFDRTLVDGIALVVWSPCARFQSHCLQRRSVFVTGDVIGAADTRVVAHVGRLHTHTHCATLSQRGHLIGARQAERAILMVGVLPLTTLRALRKTVVAIFPGRAQPRALLRCGSRSVAVGTALAYVAVF